jgi:hypothetical protein
MNQVPFHAGYIGMDITAEDSNFCRGMLMSVLVFEIEFGIFGVF